MSTCFYTCYDSLFKDTARGLVNSIRGFYPEITILEYELPRVPNSPYPYHDADFDLRAFCDFHLQKGRELLEEYDRVISVDADEIMCSECPELFEDFDFAVVQNNFPNSYGSGENIECYDGNRIGIHVNAGLTVCTNKDVWDEWITEYSKSGWEILTEQLSLNDVYQNSKANIKLLEFPDKTYGITSMKDYHAMRLVGSELWAGNKKVCIFHGAGSTWKDKGKLVLDSIENIEAREFLRSLQGET